jgi:hypothetical protein
MNRYVGNLPPMPGVFPDYPAPVVDEWRRKQPDIPVRSEAIRRLTLLGAGKAPKAKGGHP